MPDFPAFVRNPQNRIARGRVSAEHVHDFDEYVVVLEGRCSVLLDGRRVELVAGQELHIPKGTRQTMAVVAGTRTMHVFGGKRAKREAEMGNLSYAGQNFHFPIAR